MAKLKTIAIFLILLTSLAFLAPVKAVSATLITRCTYLADPLLAQPQSNVQIGDYQFFFYVNYSIALGNDLYYRSLSPDGDLSAPQLIVNLGFSALNPEAKYTVLRQDSKIWLFYVWVDPSGGGLNTLVYYREGTVTAGNVVFGSATLLDDGYGACGDRNRKYLVACTSNDTVYVASQFYDQDYQSKWIEATWKNNGSWIRLSSSTINVAATMALTSVNGSGAMLIYGHYNDGYLRYKTCTKATGWGAWTNFHAKAASAYSHVCAVTDQNGDIHLLWKYDDDGNYTYYSYAVGYVTTSWSSPVLLDGSQVIHDIGLANATKLYWYYVPGDSHQIKYRYMHLGNHSWSSETTFQPTITTVLGSLNVERYPLDIINNVCWFLPVGGGLNDLYYKYQETVDFVTLNVIAKNSFDSSNITVNARISGAYYSTPASLACIYMSSIIFIMPNLSGYNSTHFWRFQNFSDGSTSLTRSVTMNGDKTYTAYYNLVPRGGDPGGWVNFWIGFVGLGMMFSSWIFLKHYWDKDEYATALGTWLALLVIGIGVFTIMLGA